MNTLKNILFFGLLLAVLCGVYLSLNRSTDVPLPKDLEATTKPVTVDIPGLEGGGSSLPPVSTGPVTSNPPDFPPRPPMIDSRSAADGTAPPYRPEVSIGSESTPPIPSGRGSLPAPPDDRYTQRLDSLPPPPAAPPGGNQDYPPGVRNPFGTSNGGRASDGTAAQVDSGGCEPRVTSPPSDRGLPPPSNHTSVELVEEQVEQKIKDAKYAEALLILSQLYGHPDVPADRAGKITEFLDKLAAKVIYSREHWLEDPYRVQEGDTWERIAERYHVPPLVLAKINFPDERDWQGKWPDLPPGKELKVIKGPFSAKINTDRSELTMMLAERYAGRFSIAMSSDLSLATGIWTVRDKREPTPGGNGTGKQWIQLGGDRGTISMQGTDHSWAATASGSRNSIWLSERDMGDVFGILSVGSNVIIER